MKTPATLNLPWWSPYFHSCDDEKWFLTIQSPVLLNLLSLCRVLWKSLYGSYYQFVVLLLGGSKVSKMSVHSRTWALPFPREGRHEMIVNLTTSRYSGQVHFIHICNGSVCFKLVPAAPSLRVCVNIIIFSVARSWIARGCTCGLGRLPLDRGIVWVSRFSSFMFSFRAAHQVSTLRLARLCSVPFIPVGLFLLFTSQL